MNKLYKITVFLFLALAISNAKANFLWNIENGVDLYRNSEYKNAQTFFISYINNNPNDEDGYFWLAKTYQKIKNNTLSKSNFKKSYEITIKKKDIEKNLFDDESNNENFEDYFDMAVMYFENQNYKQSRHYADLMLRLNSKSPSAYFIKAKIMYVLGDIENAKENLNKAILYNNSMLKTNLANTLKIYEIPEANKEFYYSFAYEKYFKGEISQAISYSKKYIELDEENINMQNFLVDLYIKNNNLNEAILLSENIEKKYPNNIQNLLNKTKIYKLKNENENIKPILDKIYKINPNNKELLFEFGNYYTDIKNYDEAIKYYEALINVDDSFLEGYLAYINSLIQLREIDKALELTRKTTKLNSKPSSLDYLLAQLCLLNGDYEESLEYLKEAIKKDKNKKYYLLSAKVNYILKDYKKSLENLNEINKIPFETINKEEVDEYYIKNYIALNKVENAKNYLNNKIILDKNNIIYKYYLYIIYKLQGDNNKKTQYYNQLKKAQPTNEKEYIILSDFLAEKDIKSAQKLLNKAQKKYPLSNEIYIKTMLLTKK